MKRPIEAQIEEVIIKPDKVQPIIVNFQNGHLKDEETKKMKCGLYTDPKNKKTVLAMSNDKIVYKGYRPNHDKELTYTMLAIHNKRTGKVRLIQAERWDVIPVLDEIINENENDDIDKVVALNKQFGSKKSKRRTEQYEKMKINVDSIKDQLEKSVANIEVEKEDLALTSKDVFDDVNYVPPCNRNANHVSEVYNVYDIVPEKILQTLYAYADEAVELETTDKPEFVKKILELLKTDSKRTFKMALLLYIEAVICWLGKPIKLGQKQNLIVCPHSSEVNTHIIDTYSVLSGTGRQRPASMRDKGIIHCLILSLIICNYTFDLELFSKMFIRVGIKKLQDLSRFICAVSPKGEKKMITLKLPLPQPYTKHVLKKRKK